MTESYNRLANSPLMWIGSSFGVLAVLVLAIIYFRKTVKDANKMGISDNQVKSAIRAASATSVGPVFVMLTAMLALMMYVGAPLAWKRVNFIGSVSYELQGANFAAEGMGLELGTSNLTPEYLATAAVVMPLGCVGWVVFSALFSDKMDLINMKMAGGNKLLVPILGAGALIGVYLSLVFDRVIPFGYGGFAVFAGGIAMFFLQSYNNKANIQWIKEWGLTMCMIFGMFIATVLNNLGVLG